MEHNRVYVRIAEDDDFGTASIEQRPFTEAYIRKGALLEWAKEGVEHYKKLMEEFKDDKVFAASFGAYNAFVEKLNKI